MYSVNSGRSSIRPAITRQLEGLRSLVRLPGHTFQNGIGKLVVELLIFTAMRFMMASTLDV